MIWPFDNRLFMVYLVKDANRAHSR